MERVTEQEQTTEVFENDIQLYLQVFADEQGIEDFKDVSQGVWNAALMYVRRHVFPDRSRLVLRGRLEGYTSNSYSNQFGNLNNSNCNAYDIDKVNTVCDYYIYICMLYDKEVSILGFVNLSGISQETIYNWGSNNRELSKRGCEIYKKLTQYREESLSNKLATGKQNPVGVIAILNRQFGWASPYTSDARKQQQALSGADIRAMLSTRSGQNEPKQLETQYVVVND